MMKMSYFVVGTNTMVAAVGFYDALFEGLGLTKLPAGRMTYWQGADFAFAVATPFNEEPATFGNGTMVGFDVGTQDEVTRLYETALGLGASDEGEPHQRGPFFSAYVRDLDQNKLCLFSSSAA